MLFGIVEADEAYWGGKNKWRHGSKRRYIGRGAAGKMNIIGLRQRDNGFTKLNAVNNVDASTLQGNIRNNVTLRSKVCTDEAAAYKGIAPEYIHESVNHKKGQYVNGVAHTNGMESVWTLIKQSIHGTYHAVSRGHMQLYLNEISFRMNEGNSKYSILKSIDSLLEFSIGLTVNYKMITDLSYTKLQDSNSSRQWERLTLDDMNFGLWAILDRVDERMVAK